MLIKVVEDSLCKGFAVRKGEILIFDEHNKYSFGAFRNNGHTVLKEKPQYGKFVTFEFDGLPQRFEAKKPKPAAKKAAPKKALTKRARV